LEILDKATYCVINMGLNGHALRSQGGRKSTTTLCIKVPAIAPKHGNCGESWW